jgi:hypothetical protein
MTVVKYIATLGRLTSCLAISTYTPDFLSVAECNRGPTPAGYINPSYNPLTSKVMNVNISHILKSTLEYRKLTSQYHYAGSDF